ncbi:hypothetical protein N5853_01960 [Bartonella sp. HY329]|uniref:hypothetical protein n=1 Tax=unclassified Bartonella TaxID=2645622 RepID=UPI0021C85D34|nr:MULTISPECIES: hypothetical protein [unclassified Bartonella]UXM95433.1 hypothetical protein N5853_01960 [Bartonella sp. HY329]UXN09758.1 hypothetical protein N5852_01965 [Bartonella sp. HY328]
MSASPTPFAISGINEPEKIRVLIYANNEMVHAPLNAVLKAGITSGSNENGDYVRFADGTQICWANSVSSVRPSNNQSFDEWIFPASFVSTPVVTITPLSVQNNNSVLISEIDRAKVLFNRNTNELTGSVKPLQRMAMGRWF